MKLLWLVSWPLRFYDAAKLLRSAWLKVSCLPPLWSGYSFVLVFVTVRNVNARKSSYACCFFRELLANGFCYRVDSRTIQILNCSLQLFTLHLFCNMVSRPYAGLLNCARDEWLFIMIDYGWSIWSDLPQYISVWVIPDLMFRSLCISFLKNKIKTDKKSDLI